MTGKTEKEQYEQLRAEWRRFDRRLKTILYSIVAAMYAAWLIFTLI